MYHQLVKMNKEIDVSLGVPRQNVLLANWTTRVSIIYSGGVITTAPFFYWILLAKCDIYSYVQAGISISKFGSEHDNLNLSLALHIL